MNISIFIILCLCLILTPAFSQAQAVDEEEYVFIGGIDQWVTIRGSDVTKPMILFLHGGPGSVMSPYEGAMYGDWEKDFVLVNWDQRPKVITRNYFRRISAPKKKLIVLADAAHGHNESVVEAQYMVLMKHVVSLTRQR